MGSRRPWLAAASFAALTLVLASPAHPEFKVCNQTVNLFNLAVGYQSAGSGGFETEGWWTVAANSCATLISEPLTERQIRFVYVYGTDIHGEPAIVGNTDMCVGGKRFTIPATEECWVRGYERAKFLEVDTGNSDTWTFFIRDQ